MSNINQKLMYKHKKIIQTGFIQFGPIPLNINNIYYKKG